ncbi:hypothetical protein [Agrobacterium tumefaciens]|uniref:hypothetical protein n=1 Tax=Agrobacterium tumefaciens TaxID=358 RepID=UPI001FFD4FD5|nr:hypothetical protein [Agrobacterium tumefaciens]
MPTYFWVVMWFIPMGRANSGVVHELSRMLCQYVQRARHFRNLLDLRYIANVALNDRLDVICIPVLSAAQRFAAQYLGISTGKDGSHQIVADGGFSILSLILKGVAQEAASGDSDFALRKRKQSNDLHSACERVCHPWHVMRLAEPGRRKRPGRWSVFTLSLIANNSSGAR